MHRGVRHGRETGAMGRGLRSVVWDRAIGQVVQAVLALRAVALLVPAVRTPVAAGDLVGLGVLGVVAATLPRRAARGPASRIAGCSARVATASCSRPRSPPPGTSLVFVVAARTAGVTAPLPELVPLALVVLLASAVPLNIAGWGPREGAAAWVFGAAGLGAARASTVAVVYGVMALVATLPGAVAARTPRLRRASPAPELEEARHG